MPARLFATSKGAAMCSRPCVVCGKFAVSAVGFCSGACWRRRAGVREMRRRYLELDERRALAASFRAGVAAQHRRIWRRLDSLLSSAGMPPPPVK